MSATFSLKLVELPSGRFNVERKVRGKNATKKELAYALELSDTIGELLDDSAAKSQSGESHDP
jgi:hypothetical protein